jgi:hypothetical protein
MELRLHRILTNQLVEAHLRLDPDQITQPKIERMFMKVMKSQNDINQKARMFQHQKPVRMVTRWLDFFRYILTIMSSTYTLSQMVSKNATTLIILGTLKTFAHLYRLMAYYCTSSISANLMK